MSVNPDRWLTRFGLGMDKDNLASISVQHRKAVAE